MAKCTTLSGAAAAVVLVAGLLIPGTPARAADPVDRGKQLYGRCVACHSPARDRTGPRHCGVVGRRAGSIEGFAYSKAMRRSNIIWTTDRLDVFLEAPRKFVPGTSMGYAGIADPEDRRDLIAYLESLNAESDACP